MKQTRDNIEWPKLAFARARCLDRAGRRGEAARIAVRVSELASPRSAHDWALVAEGALDQGEPRQARRALLKGASVDPTSTLLLFVAERYGRMTGDWAIVGPLVAEISSQRSVMAQPVWRRLISAMALHVRDSGLVRRILEDWPIDGPPSLTLALQLLGLHLGVLSEPPSPRELPAELRHHAALLNLWKQSGGATQQVFPELSELGRAWQHLSILLLMRSALEAGRYGSMPALLGLAREASIPSSDIEPFWAAGAHRAFAAADLDAGAMLIRAHRGSGRDSRLRDALASLGSKRWEELGHGVGRFRDAYLALSVARILGALGGPEGERWWSDVEAVASWILGRASAPGGQASKMLVASWCALEDRPQWTELAESAIADGPPGRLRAWLCQRLARHHLARGDVARAARAVDVPQGDREKLLQILGQVSPSPALRWRMIAGALEEQRYEDALIDLSTELERWGPKATTAWVRLALDAALVARRAGEVSTHVLQDLSRAVCRVELESWPTSPTLWRHSIMWGLWRLAQCCLMAVIRGEPELSRTLLHPLAITSVFAAIDAAESGETDVAQELLLVSIGAWSAFAMDEDTLFEFSSARQRAHGTQNSLVTTTQFRPLVIQRLDELIAHLAKLCGVSEARFILLGTMERAAIEAIRKAMGRSARPSDGGPIPGPLLTHALNRKDRVAELRGEDDEVWCFFSPLGPGRALLRSGQYHMAAEELQVLLDGGEGRMLAGGDRATRCLAAYLSSEDEPRLHERARALLMESHAGAGMAMISRYPIPLDEIRRHWSVVLRACEKLGCRERMAKTFAEQVVGRAKTLFEGDQKRDDRPARPTEKQMAALELLRSMGEEVNDSVLRGFLALYLRRAGVDLANLGDHRQALPLLRQALEANPSIRQTAKDLSTVIGILCKQTFWNNGDPDAAEILVVRERTILMGFHERHRGTSPTEIPLCLDEIGQKTLEPFQHASVRAKARGDHGRAVEHMLQASRVAPGDDSVRPRLRRLLEELGYTPDHLSYRARILERLEELERSSLIDSAALAAPRVEKTRWLLLVLEKTMWRLGSAARYCAGGLQ
jgi:tetratricopeptide (TPR) repeat protein